MTDPALIDAIKRWHLIIKGIPLPPELIDCPLCKKYKHCAGCPVAIKTEFKQCINTPYEDWIMHRSAHIPQSKEQKCYCPKCVEIATRYHDFLVSLCSENF